jgi:hypothetical protein
VARQFAQSGKQDKTFTCPSWISLAPGKWASVKLHLCLQFASVIYQPYIFFLNSGCI